MNTHTHTCTHTLTNNRGAQAGAHIDMAAGYFNFPSVYEEAVLSSKADFTVVTAHPKVGRFSVWRWKVSSIYPA